MTTASDYRTETEPAHGAPHPQAPAAASEAGTDPGLAAYVSAQAEADIARARAESEARAAEMRAKAEADAIRVAAEAEAEKQRIANERAAMKLEAERAAHAAKIARLEAEKAERDKVKAKAESEAADAERAAADKAAEQTRAEVLWKWSARSIYAVGLIIALPIQLLAFYEPDKPFMVAAPLLLEGMAVVLAIGAAWAVAHRRDVAPYRVGIGIAAVIAAAVNIWHGSVDPEIGVNAGLVGGIASLGGPAVLMAYEHGIAQKRDGIPSWRERRDAGKAAARKQAEAEQRAKEREAEAKRRQEEKAEAESRASADQERKDKDRRDHHEDVWEVAEALRSARGAAVVSDQIWADAWYRVTGSKTVGIRPEIEAASRAAQARMKAAVEGLLDVPGSLCAQGEGGFAGADAKAPVGELSEGDLDRARGAERLSISGLRAVGVTGNDRYITAVRDAVRAEREQRSALDAGEGW